MENPTVNNTTTVLSEKELKAITKFVLNEIAPNYRKDDEHPIFQMFQGLQQHMQNQEDNSPAANDPKEAIKLNKSFTTNVKRAIADLLKSHFEKNKEKYDDAVHVIHYTREQILYLAVVWARKIDKADENEVFLHDLHETMNAIRTHIDEIKNTLRIVIKDDLRKYQNYINAVKHIRYINELIKAIDTDFVKLMKLAEKSGAIKPK